MDESARPDHQSRSIEWLASPEAFLMYLVATLFTLLVVPTLL